MALPAHHFVVSGLFRGYYVAPGTAEEYGVFFVPEGVFVTSLKGLLTQKVCPSYIAALEDAELQLLSRLVPK